MSAIEVLKREKELYIKQILEIEEANQSRPTDIAEMYDKSIKTLKEFVGALDKALLALEKQESLKEWLEKEIVAFETEINGFEKKLEMNTWKKEQEIEYVKLRVLELESKVYLSRKVLERVGEQK